MNIKTQTTDKLHCILIRYSNEITTNVELTIGYLHALPGLNINFLADCKKFENIDIELQMQYKSQVEHETSLLYKIGEQLKEHTQYIFAMEVVSEETLKKWLHSTSINMRLAFANKFGRDWLVK